MNRKYDRSTLLDRLEATRNITRPDGVPISIWADMIVGFPGETEQDHAESVDLIKDYGVNKLHAFPFSDHTSAHSVPAAKFVDQIDQNTKYERLREMIAVWDDVRSKFLQENIEKPLQLLVEKCDWENYRGWSENYIWLDQNNSILQKEPKKNTILTCVLTKPEEKSGAEEKPSII